MRIPRLLALLLAVMCTACGMGPFRHAAPNGPAADTGPQLPGLVRSGVVRGDDVASCAASGAPIEAQVLASDQLDGQIITAVLQVTNLGDTQAQALHAYDLRDSQQRLFNMADRVVFPGYPDAKAEELAAWPDLRSDYALIDPGDADNLFVAFKVAADSRGWELVAAPIEQEHC